MLKYLSYLPFFCLISTFCLAQQLPNYAFQNPDTLICSLDSQPVVGFHEWEGFQTADSSFSGPRDSNCLDIATSNSGLYVSTGQFDIQRPLFIGSLLDSISHVLLDSNGLYKLSMSLYFDNGPLFFDLGANCRDGFCTGAEVGIMVPDSFGSGHEWRRYTSSALTQISGNYYGVEFCFPTEFFSNENFIQQAYFKLSVDNANPGAVIRSDGVYIEDMTPYTEKVRHIDGFFNGIDYEFHYNNFSNWACYCSNKMIMYNDTTYPSPAHPAYVEATPSPNVGTQETVNVYVDWDATLIYQPYAQIRGGLVLGDTLRHLVNLVNNGGTICMYPFVELVFQGGDGYTHRSGKLNMDGPMSCMQFGKGSRLTVTNGSHLDYGRPGVGMLALRTDGSIYLDHEASFKMENVLSLGEYRGEQQPGNYALHLKPGSEFVFGPDATLTVANSRFPESTFLDVYMEGGTLDDHHLTAEERSHIRRIYPTPSREFDDNLKVLGNPFGEELQVTFVANGSFPLAIELVDLNGRRLQGFEALTAQGVNVFTLPTSELATGTYLVHATTPYAHTTKLVVKEK